MNNSAIHSILENDNEDAIVNFLKTNKNLFISKLVLSQSYASIINIKAMNFEYRDFFDHFNIRIDEVSDVMDFLSDSIGDIIEKCYIIERNKLTIKTKDTIRSMELRCH